MKSRDEIMNLNGIFAIASTLVLIVVIYAFPISPSMFPPHRLMYPYYCIRFWITYTSSFVIRSSNGVEHVELR